MSRISTVFEKLAQENRAAFIPFIMAGDPGLEISAEILKGLPGAGADIIELGICFTDPMADGPTIQAAGLRALEAGQTLRDTLAMVSAFRKDDENTPIVLMGYYNPIFSYGVDAFLADAVKAGVDGLIIVDLPPEEDGELFVPARQAGIDAIRLATPTTDAARLPKVVANASGFIYYVSVAGITGKAAGTEAAVEDAVARLKAASGLPIAVGFGIKTAQMAAEFAKTADAVVVGSAIVEQIGEAVEHSPSDMNAIVNRVLTFARDIADAVRTAR